MASTDATAIPIKNQAYRVVFPILDADGDLVTGATGLDSEISKDQGTFADCTNEATEIATSSGVYYLDLTSTEMNADNVAIIVKTSTSGAKTTVLTLYPAEAGDIIVNVKQMNGTSVTGRDIGASVLLSSGTGTGQLDFTSGVVKGNVTQWSSSNVATPDAAGYPKVTHKVGTGTGEINLSSGLVPIQSGTGTGQLDFTSGVVKANLAQILGTALTETAGQIAAAFKQFFDVASPTGTMKAISTVTNLTNAPTAGDFTSTMKTSIGTAVAASAVASVTGNVGGNVTGSVGSLASQAKADVNAEVLDVLTTDTFSQPASVPAATSSLKDKINWLFTLSRNKRITTSSLDTLRNDADNADISTAVLSDDGTTFTRDEYA